MDAKDDNDNDDTSLLASFQRSIGSLVMNPLTPSYRMKNSLTDGRSTADIAEALVKPRGILTGRDRIEIYNRQYWFRLIDSLYDDFPGLRAVVGQHAFDRIIKAYLTAYPSSSFSLRDLGQHLYAFLNDNEKIVGRRWQAALGMVSFEWAQIIAFDGHALPPVTQEILQHALPETLVFKLQPYVTLLKLRYPFDDIILAMKKGEAGSSEAAVSELAQRDKNAPMKLPPRQNVFVVVHRFDNMLYYKRLDCPSFQLLKMIGNGLPLALACEKIFPFVRQKELSNIGDFLQRNFAMWSRLGWLVNP